MTGDSGGFIELSIKWKLPYNILPDPPQKTTPLQPQIPPTSPSAKASSKPKPQTSTTPPLAKSPSKLKQPTSPTPQSSPSSKAPSKPASSPASKKPSASLTPSHPAVAQSVKPSIKKQKPPTVSTPPAHVSPPPVVAGSVTKPPASSFQPAKPSKSTEAVQYSFQDSDVSVEVMKLNNSLPPLRKTADKKHGKSKKTPKVSKTRSEREAMVVQESDNNAPSSGDSSDVSGGGGAKVRWPYLDAVQPVVGGGGSTNGNETGASSSVSVTSEERGSAAGGHSDMKVSSGHGDTSALGVGGMVPGGWSQSDVSESGGEVVEVYEMNMSSLKVVVSDTNWPVLKETQRDNGAQGANILAVGGGSGGSGGSDGGVASASVSIVSVTDLSAESVEEELEEELEEDVSDEDTMFEETLHKASGLCMCACSSMC